MKYIFLFHPYWDKDVIANLPCLVAAFPISMWSPTPMGLGAPSDSRSLVMEWKMLLGLSSDWIAPSWAQPLWPLFCVCNLQAQWTAEWAEAAAEQAGPELKPSLILSCVACRQKVLAWHWLWASLCTQIWDWVWAPSGFFTCFFHEHQDFQPPVLNHSEGYFKCQKQSVTSTHIRDPVVEN